MAGEANCRTTKSSSLLLAGVVGVSSFTIKPLAADVPSVPSVAPLALDKVTVKELSGSNDVSPATLTVMVAVVWPAAKNTVPEGKTFPTKSAASAGLEPLPVTAHAADDVPVTPPARVTVKVNGVLPLSPSLLFALAAAIESVDALIITCIAVSEYGPVLLAKP